MAEIKSTLDLVMERTKHLKMSQDEKRALDVEETLKKIPGLIQKYVEGAMKDRAFRKEIENCCKVDSDVVKKEVVKELARSLTFKNQEKDLRVIDALRIIDPDNSVSLVDLENCIRNFYDSQKNLMEDKTSKFLNELERIGIKGSAILPRVELTQDDLERLQALKAACLNLLSRFVQS